MEVWKQIPQVDDDEIWKSIPGFDGRYEASNLGRIRSYRASGETRLMVARTATSGSLVVTLCKDGKYSATTVARLVLITFKGPSPKKGALASRKDFDQSNNRLDNLFWYRKPPAPPKSPIVKNKAIPPKTPGEVWKPIPGLDGWYEASDQGRIRSLRGLTAIIMAHTGNQDGTPCVAMTGPRGRVWKMSIGRAVLLAFTNKGLNCPKYARHIDGDKNNNKVDNLEWNIIPGPSPRRR